MYIWYELIIINSKWLWIFPKSTVSIKIILIYRLEWKNVLGLRGSRPIGQTYLFLIINDILRFDTLKWNVYKINKILSGLRGINPHWVNLPRKFNIKNIYIFRGFLDSDNKFKLWCSTNKCEKHCKTPQVYGENDSRPQLKWYH